MLLAKLNRTFAIGVLMFCGAIWIGFTLRQSAPIGEPSISPNDGLVFGRGMESEPLASQTHGSISEMLDEIGFDFKEEWSLKGSRVMTVLIPDGGCKTYVDDGDGVWQPISETSENGNCISSELSDPFTD